MRSCIVHALLHPRILPHGARTACSCMRIQIQHHIRACMPLLPHQLVYASVVMSIRASSCSAACPCMRIASMYTHNCGRVDHACACLHSLDITSMRVFTIARMPTPMLSRVDRRRTQVHHVRPYMRRQVHAWSRLCPCVPAPMLLLMPMHAHAYAHAHADPCTRMHVHAVGLGYVRLASYVYTRADTRARTCVHLRAHSCMHE